VLVGAGVQTLQQQQLQRSAINTYRVVAAPISKPVLIKTLYGVINIVGANIADIFATSIAEHQLKPIHVFIAEMVSVAIAVTVLFAVLILILR